ncbi:MAG: class I SAM-dependent methyltransferase, partial [Proteobacteria bacterium]|nr:class I SAM-dependent methyltransferase [Pseudomonadota bacterium]
MDKALAIRPSEPRLIDAYARALLAKGELDRAEAWAEELIASTGPESLSILTTALTTSLVASTRRKMIDLFGTDWTATVKVAGEVANEPAIEINDDASRHLERFVNGSDFAAHKNAAHPVACPACGEDRRIIRRNRVALTGAFHLYFDLASLASEMSPGKPDDAGALQRAENFLTSVARSNPAYFSVGLCECGGCGICYVDHPFKPDQVKRYYASQARAYEIGGQAIFSRAHAYDWVRSKAAPIAYLRGLDKPFAGLSFLDAGCAEGIMCALMRLLGAEASGVEPNTRASRYAQEILGLQGVVEGLYGDASFANRTFDIVLSHHTMEHALNPPEFARALARHTAPGGYLLLQLPCADTTDDSHLAG